jgi:hypothetical protein
MTRPLRIEIAGIDVTECVTDVNVQYASDYEDHRTFRVDVRDINALIAALLEAVCWSIGPLHARPEASNRQMEAVREALEPDPPGATHGFYQDPDEPGARLCGECGMWPEHHNHVARWETGRCVCQECIPDAADLPDDQHQVYGDADRHPVMWAEDGLAAIHRPPSIFDRVQRLPDGTVRISEI